MEIFNAIGLPFRSIDRVPLPEDPTVEAQAKEQGKVSSDEEEDAESSESRELSKQIDFHVVVLDDDQPRTAATTSDQIAHLIVTKSSDQ